MTIGKQVLSVLRRVVLTPQEKKAALCVLGALLIGFGTKQYRESHSRPAANPTTGQESKTKKQARTQRASPSPPPSTTPASQGEDD